MANNSTMRRLSASIPGKLYDRLERLADHEGRSVSNLVSYLLEHSLDMRLQGYSPAGGGKPTV